MTGLILLFIRHFWIAYQVAQLLLKKFLDSMLGLQNDEMTALWENDSLAFTFYYIFVHLHTCTLAYLHTSTLAWSRFLLYLNQTWSGRGINFNGKMSKEGAYCSVLDNISQCLNIFGYIWQYWTLSGCSLQYHNSEIVTWTILNNTEQYWVILSNIGQ